MVGKYEIVCFRASRGWYIKDGDWIANAYTRRRVNCVLRPLARRAQRGGVGLWMRPGDPIKAEHEHELTSIDENYNKQIKTTNINEVQLYNRLEI